MSLRVFARRLTGVLELHPGFIAGDSNQKLAATLTMSDGTTYELERVEKTYVVYREKAPVL